jgi:hypothetical protein
MSAFTAKMDTGDPARTSQDPAGLETRSGIVQIGGCVLMEINATPCIGVTL